MIKLNTRRHYRHILDAHILPILGPYMLDEVKQIQVKKLINDLNDRGYEWETQNKVRLLIHDFYNVAIDNEYALTNPTRGIRLAKNRPNERTVLSIDDQF